MHFFSLFVFAILCQWEMAHSAACNCGLGSGVNPCRGRGRFRGLIEGGLIEDRLIEDGLIEGEIEEESCHPLVVRPQPLPSIDIGANSKPRVVCKTIGGLQPLRPISSLCACEKTIVKPAVVPRPSCASCISRAQARAQRDSFARETIEIGPSEEVIRFGSSGDAFQINEAGETIRINEGGETIRINEAGETVQINEGGETIRISPAGETIRNDRTGETIRISPSGETINIREPGQRLVEIEQGPLDIQYPLCGLPVLPKRAHIPQAPADAVSIELALKKQQQRNAIAVDRQLAYGFKQLPKDLPCACKPAAFPEERLYNLNGEVLELKTLSERTSVDEEALAELEEIEEEEEAEEIATAGISLGDLGYGPANIQAGRFISLDVPEAQPASACELEGPSGYRPICRDGYKSGEVIIKGGPVDSQVVIPRRPEPICLDGEERRGSVYYSESSRNVQNARSNVLIKKLRGGCL